MNLIILCIAYLNKKTEIYKINFLHIHSMIFSNVYQLLKVIIKTEYWFLFVFFYYFDYITFYY